MSRWMVRSAILIGLALVLVVVLVLGRSSEQSEQQELRLPVTVTEPERRTLRQSFSVGSFAEANTVVTVTPKASGEIVALPAVVGREVAVGDLLARLDAEQYQLAVSRAQTAFDAAESAYRRAQDLSETGSVSAQGLEQARTQFESAQSGLDNARINLRDTEVRAPVAGEIIRVHRSVGELAGPSVPVVTIGETRDLVVSAQVPEQYARFFVDGGQDIPTTAVFPALDDLSFEARVEELSPFVDAATRTFEVTLRILGDTRYIFPGMFVELEFTSARREDAFSLPIEALVDGRLWFVDEEGYATSLALAPEFVTEAHIVVPEDLAGRAFVVEGQSFLREGVPVRVVNEAVSE
ncbi:MAG: efflux RND transporter periplasmic adaptor subunit [Spirochaetales bacterium]